MNCNHRDLATGQYLIQSTKNKRGEYAYCRMCMKVWSGELEESQEIEGVRDQLAREAEAKHKALRIVMKRGDVLLQAKGFAEYVRDHSTGDAYSMAKSLLLAIDSLPRIPQ